MITNKQFSVAFSGSGFLAPIHAGAAAAILDSGNQIVEVAGTSGGSIVAGAMGIGMKSADLKNLALNTSFHGLLHPDFLGLLSNKALCSGDALLELLNSIFKGALLGGTNIPCHIVSTHVEAGASYVFNPETDPATEIALACRASAAVPFIYAPVKYKGMTLVDGGVINNIPVDRLTAQGTIRIGIDVAESSKYSTEGVFDYASSLIGMMLSANENSHEALGIATGAHILAVPTQEWFLNTNLSTEQKQTLYQAGYDHVTEFLKTQT